jgi:hypothetical protein
MKIADGNAIDAWHFLRADGKTNYEPHVLVAAGETLTVDYAPILCERGLHASVRALDAFRYAPGPIACRVKVWGEVVIGDDKLAGTHRQCVSMIDATNILHEFACRSAEAALLLADVTDMRCWQAIEAKRAWLRKEIGDAELAAAWDAAWDAARAAAWAAAWDEAWDEAWDAARAAAWAAAWDEAWDEAWDAARAAAWAAAWDEAWDEMNTTLESMLMEAM